MAKRQASPYSTLASRQRRRGQALLLAVLVMIFAALLGAAFIAVVSLNLNETARQKDKTAADQSARAGLKYVNDQLTYSKDGENWFKNNFETASPTTTFLQDVSGNSLYYTAVDRAQGWAGQYVKFPDPRQPNPTGNQFLARVERIDRTLDPTSSNPDADKIGMLKITVIGLSPDDPSAWSRIVAYKKPWFPGSAMRVVGNYDFENKVVPSAKVASYDSSTGYITMKDVKGRFPDGIFPIMIGTTQVRGAIVGKYKLSGAPLTLKLATDFTAADEPKPDDRIEMAATLGAPTSIDLDNDGTSSAADPVEGSRLEVSTASASQPGSIFANGSLWLQGRLDALSLCSYKDAFGSTGRVPGTVEASGLINVTSGADDKAQVQGFSQPLSQIVKSSDPTFPGSGISQDLVNDSLNRIQGIPSQTRNVKPFTPPDLTNRENLERFRELTQFSPYNSSSVFTGVSGTPNSSSSMYGYGEGLYIDNKEDVEKSRYYDDTTHTAPAPMSQVDLEDMWLSPKGLESTLPFVRGSKVAQNLRVTSTDSLQSSLEDGHVRGWISSKEFLARGVLIELGNNGTTPILTVTRDARADDDRTALDDTFGNVDTKAWRDAAGNFLPGVYRQVFTWPSNGVIFAEGNIRIKGTATNVPHSLTVVSMNNIYIEGNLSVQNTTGNPKVLLMAKRNVVLNPTRVLATPDSQTRVRTATLAAITLGTSITVDVYDVSGFEVGDVVEFFTGSTISGSGYVTAITAGASPSLTLTGITPSAGTIPVDAGVRDVEPVFSDTERTNEKIDSTSPGIQRRFNVDGASVPAGTRFAFVHGAEQKDALKVGLTGDYVAAGSIFWSNKRNEDGAGTLLPGHTLAESSKVLIGNYTVPSGGPTRFPGTGSATVPASDTDALNLRIDESTSPHVSILKAIDTAGPFTNPPVPTVSWQFDASLVGFGDTPFFYLAGVGGRYDNRDSASSVTEWRHDLNKPLAVNTEVTIPLSTSITPWLNAGSSVTPAYTTLTDEYWDTTLSDYGTTRTFGFNPAYMAGANPDQNREDVLTTDRSFYGDTNRDTVDSRVLSFSRLQNGENSVTFRRSDNIDSAAVNNLPAYYLKALKLENVTLDATTHTVTDIEPAVNIAVNAYVYAQEGSWFIISGDYFDPKIHYTSNSSYYDYNGNGTPDVGEWVESNSLLPPSYGAGDFADLNRNGVKDDNEDPAYLNYRYGRYNYAINFTGAIAENKTAVVMDTKHTAMNTIVDGNVQDWMSKWATVTCTVTTGSPPVVTPVSGGITYTFDPSYLEGDMDNDPGFKPALSPDLVFAG